MRCRVCCQQGVAVVQVLGGCWKCRRLLPSTAGILAVNVPVFGLMALMGDAIQALFLHLAGMLLHTWCAWYVWLGAFVPLTATWLLLCLVSASAYL